MADVESDKSCAICYGEREDLRMLPCWHVACMSCILGTTQSGRGRAVKCHLCRGLFLFENVRSLPKPIKCGGCQKFVSRPKKFPCCPAVYCADCVENLPENEAGEVLCPNLCTGDDQSGTALFRAKICPLCFGMHSTDELYCGHNICLGCAKMLALHERDCPLCMAMSTPTPVPVNPILESGVTAANNRSVPDNGQQISQLQLQSAMEIYRSWELTNSQNKQAGKVYQKNIAAISRKYMKEDLPKIVIAAAVFFTVAIIWGFQFWIWAVLTGTLGILRPTTVYLASLWGTIFFFMRTYNLWNYFFQLIAFMVLDYFYNKLVNAGLRKYFPSQPFAIYIIARLSVAVKVIPVFYCFSPPFVHESLANLGYMISSYFARKPNAK